MDISKASNFERFVLDLVGRDATRVAGMWQELDEHGEFDVAGTPAYRLLRVMGIVSGCSRHADRLETIRETRARYGLTIDTHTADGVHVAQRWREPGVPMICLETAQAAKFADTIREAIGEAPARPAGFEDLEARRQRFDRMAVDVEVLKRYIAERC